MVIIGRTPWGDPDFAEMDSPDGTLRAHLTALCGDLHHEDDAHRVSRAARTTPEGYVFDTAGYLLAAQGSDIVLTAKYGTFQGVIGRDVLATLLTQWAGQLESQGG